jgi:hypothetical protein
MGAEAKCDLGPEWCGTAYFLCITWHGPSSIRIAHTCHADGPLTSLQLQAKITDLEGKASNVASNAISQVIGNKPAPKLILIGPPGAGECETR